LRIIRIRNHYFFQPMYLCNCNGITKREIAGAAELGCTTLADLQRDLGVGTCCGKCVPEAQEVLRQCTRSCANADCPRQATRGDD